MRTTAMLSSWQDSAGEAPKAPKGKEEEQEKGRPHQA